jgi:hypothetical protein
MHLDYDIKTITVGDYTIEMAIKEESYYWFLENIYQAHDRQAG